MESEENRRAFVTQMLDAYADSVYRLAVVWLKNRADAEDAVQESFLRLFKTDTEFASSEHVKAWLLKVTANYCRNLLKNPWKRRVTPMDELCMAVTEPDGREVVEEVLALPVKYRNALYLFYFEGYSCGETARMLDEKEATVRTRLMRGRSLLKKRLTGGFEDEI